MAPLKVPTCEEFCDLSAEVCADSSSPRSVKAYPSKSSCREICATYTPGSLDDPTSLEDDTLLCRYDQLRKAQQGGDLPLRCMAASLGGFDNAEGGPCSKELRPPQEVYCARLQQICPVHFGEQFTDIDACMLAAQSIPLMLDPSQDVAFGNSLRCRLYHTMAAIQQSVHCPHALGQYPCCDLDPLSGECKP